MEDYKKTLIANITESISEFDLKYMDVRQDGDAECEKLFTEFNMKRLRDSDYPNEDIEQIKQQLAQKNIDVINALTDKDIKFYQYLLEKLKGQPVFTIKNSEYLDYCEVGAFLFDMEGNLVFLGGE